MRPADPREKDVKRTKKLHLWCFLLCVSCFAAPQRVGAWIGSGRLTLLPELGIQETYRSNIYLTESAKKSDLITTMTPGAGLRYLFGRNSLDLGYKVGFLSFGKYSSNNYQDHRAHGQLNLLGPGGLQFTLADAFTRSTLERVGVITRQRPFHYNTFSGAANYGFADRWSASAKYLRDDQTFDSFRDRSAEYTNNLYGASLYYRFLPRMSGLVEYDYVVKDFVSSTLSDHKDRLAYAGVAFDPAGKLKGSFKAGYGWKNFDTHVAGRDNSPANWIMAAQIVEAFDARTSLTLDATRALADDIDIGNASYIDTFASVAFQHYFTAKIGAAGTVTYRQGDYLDKLTEPVTGASKLRTDKAWIFGGALFYQIQPWLQTRLEYQFQDKASNFAQYSYNEHRVILRLVFTP